MVHINTIRMIFFSPTGTTKKVLNAVASGISKTAEVIFTDLTTPEKRKTCSLPVKEDLVLLGTPVYEEHVPGFVRDILPNFQGTGQPAIVISMYGNIGFGLSLKELSGLAGEANFRPVAAASFIGEHSFSRPDNLIGGNRPDQDDISAAADFGKAVFSRLNSEEGVPETGPRLLPGKLPLMAKILPENSAGFFTRSPEVKPELCTNCGACWKKCPAGAISKEDLSINADICLRCFACVRVCAKKARGIDYKREKLVRTVLGVKGKKRREPLMFIGDVRYSA